MIEALKRGKKQISTTGWPDAKLKSAGVHVVARFVLVPGSTAEREKRKRLASIIIDLLCDF